MEWDPGVGLADFLIGIPPSGIPFGTGECSPMAMDIHGAR